MKKIVAMMLCLTMLGAAVLTVKAAGSAYMSLSSSAGTIYRGETFSLTVKLTNDQSVGYGGIMLNFDSSVFEIVGGSCHISGATAEVSAANGGGVFAIDPDAVVSGTIFTIKMRVKDNAAFGKYSISGNGSLNGAACGTSGTGVTVACQHAFGNCIKIDDNAHQSTCTVCGEKKTENHTWDSGTVTKAATCKEEGSQKLTCTGCGATKTEKIPVSNDHKFGSWSKASDANHTHTCSVCGKKETAAHTWNQGKVTKKATCQETGSKTLTCTGCKATKIVEISKTDHTYTAWIMVDENSHTRQCTVCQIEETVSHSYSQEWEHDEAGHFQSCDACGHEKDRAAHVPGPEATQTTDQICTICQRILQPNTAHEHVFASDWTADETGHWHTCQNCNEKEGFGDHAYDDVCDAACNICGMEREAPHVPGEIWRTDETGHWRQCLLCKVAVGFEAHTPGPEATKASSQVCTVCQYEIAPVLAHDHVYDAEGTSHWHVCACGQRYETDAENCEICAAAHRAFPWWIVCIAEAVVFGGVTVFLVLRSKKKK